jgi:hypothetical protein
MAAFDLNVRLEEEDDDNGDAGFDLNIGFDGNALPCLLFLLFGFDLHVRDDDEYSGSC